MKTLEELIEKYNARTVEGGDGLNGWDGCNRIGDMRYDSRKLKAFLSGILREEFPGMKYSLSVRVNDYTPITLRLTGTAREMYRPYDEIGLYAEGRILEDSAVWHRLFVNSPVCRVSSWGEPFERRIYEHYLTTCTADVRSPEDACLLREPYATAARFFLALVDSYSFDHSDPYTDYYSSGIECNVYVEPDLSDREPGDVLAGTDVEGITDEMQIFARYPLEPGESEKTAARLREWDERRKAEDMRYEAEQAKARAEAEKRAREREAQRERAMAGVLSVRDLDESGQYAIRGCMFPNWNKPANLAENLANMEKGGQEAEGAGTVAWIVREVDMTPEAFGIFSSSLLDDWPELLAKDGAGIGGCGHYKADLSEPVDYGTAYRMTDEEQRAAGIVWVRACVLVRVNGGSEIVVDPEGHTYARYVGFIPDDMKPERQRREPDELELARETIAAQAEEIERLKAELERVRKGETPKAAPRSYEQMRLF